MPGGLFGRLAKSPFYGSLSMIYHSPQPILSNRGKIKEQTWQATSTDVLLAAQFGNTQICAVT
jgi:hypothetical protein